MKILYFCTYYHRAMIFRDSMNMLAKMGHEMSAFNAVAYNTTIEDKYKSIMDSSVMHTECFYKWDRLFYHLKQHKIKQALLKSCNVKEFDLIHSHTLLNGGYALYQIKKRFGVPYIVSVRDTDINTFLKFPLFPKIANKIVKEASGIQFLSYSYRDLFIDKYINPELKNEALKKSTVIGNGLEEFWLINKAAPKNLEDKRRIKILSVGSIEKRKDPLTTVNAVKELIDKNYSIQLTFIGQVINKSLLKKINKYSFVTVIPFTAQEELINLYRSNDIFILPSITETFGRAYAEAMSQGLPIIYTKGQGFDGNFTDGDVGFAVPGKDSSYIADSVIKILTDYSNMSCRCIEKCSQFDWEQLAHRLSDFYQNVL